MNQPVPDVSEADVIRIVERDFPPADFPTVMAVLREYGVEDRQKEENRVRIAALKLAGGDLNALRRAIGSARQDCRDVIAGAEYPEYTKTVLPGAGLPEKRVREVVERDASHYRDWLNRGS